MATIHKERHWRRTIITVAIALCDGVSQLAVAQEAKGLNVDVERCVTIEKPEERLACFEAQVEAARQRAASATASEATGAGAGAIAGASTAASTGAAERIPSSTGAGEPVGLDTAPAGVSQKTTSEPRSAENFGLAERSPERASRASTDRNRRDSHRVAPDGSERLCDHTRQRAGLAAGASDAVPAAYGFGRAAA